MLANSRRVNQMEWVQLSYERQVTSIRRTLESKTQSKVTTKAEWDMNTITETRED